ncbi:hypothetical protein BH23PLA1_BH23PLA1_39910 [soil metagenome]
MISTGAALSFLLVLAVDLPESAADAVKLQDGRVVLGQLVRPATSNRVQLHVRRDWVETNLPDRFERWEQVERPYRLKAVAQRRERLEAWQQERRPVAEEGQDRIAPWLAREVERLRKVPEGDRPPLLMVGLDRREVASIVERSEDQRRWLRQGWRAGFEDVEAMPLDRLQAGLQARGFALGAIDPAPIDDLLPVPLESDRRWLARRASTEVLHESGLRFVRFQDLLFPEQMTGEAPAAGALLSTLGQLFGDGPKPDPIASKGRDLEARGRVGMVVTQLEMAADFSTVRVESALHVRTGPGRWEVAARQSATVRPGDQPADAGAPLEADPQVQAAFRMFEGLGLGAVDPQTKRLSLDVGAATRRALQEAGSALPTNLESAALRVD